LKWPERARLGATGAIGAMGATGATGAGGDGCGERWVRGAIGCGYRMPRRATWATAAERDETFNLVSVLAT
jgi:hypothetical protein